MADWSEGYVTDVDYTHGYYTELNPLRAEFALLVAGLNPGKIENACELGFGQGLSVNIHAAAGGMPWCGTDFNPSQAGRARELASASGAGINLSDNSFAEFCNRSDLPEFDFIGLHGILSWISEPNQNVIVEFLRRKLKIGGILYVSYNTPPGWTSMLPLRDLLSQFLAVNTPIGNGIIPRIDAAIEFAEKFLETDPGYARANPQIVDRIKGIKDQDRHYLAHEYFNRDWHPMHFSDLAAKLGDAKLSYACSATYLDDIELINLSSKQQELLASISDIALRDTVRDFMVNRQFRKDYWVKGPRKLSSNQQRSLLLGHRVILVKPRSEITTKVAGAFCEANLADALLNPVLDVLADHQPKTLEQVETASRAVGVNINNIMMTIRVLIGRGDIASVQEDTQIARALPAVRRLNGFLLAEAHRGDGASFIASPVTGGGVMFSRFHLLFIDAYSKGHTTPQEMASFVWETLSSQGQVALKDGAALATPEANLTELARLAGQFLITNLPIARGLQLV